jgi:hypothetical protein
VFKEEGNAGLHSTESKSGTDENESLACEKNGNDGHSYELRRRPMVMPDAEKAHKASYREEKERPQQEKVPVVIEIAGRQLKCISHDRSFPVRHAKRIPPSHFFVLTPE